jgi:hypothetical protein
MTSRLRPVALFCSGVLLLGACGRMNGNASSQDSAANAMLSAAERRAGWRSLLALENWRAYQGTTIPAAWSTKDSILMKSGVGEDIVSKQEYTDFELVFDWMLNEGGNSGLFYRATEEYPKIYWSAPEYALLDDAKHPDGRNVITSAGAAHSLYPSPRGVVKPAGQWNSTRVLVKGTHVEHWMNGQKVVEYDYGTPDFVARVAKSKFNRWPNFALAKKGLIGIQGDHGGVLQIRGIRIRELK